MVRFRLDNKRMPLAARARPNKLQKAQIARCVDPDGDATIKEARATENLQLLEVVDVIDIATGAPTYQLYQWPHGSGILFEHGTTRVVGDFVQHTFDQQPPDLELRAALAAAYDDAIPRLGLTREVDFLPGTPPRAAQPAGSQLDDAIAAMRTAVAGGAKPTDDELWKLVGPAFGTSLRPVPALRLADLTLTQRAGLELIADLGKPCAYGRLGLPLGRHFFYGDPQLLARYLGRVPAGPLEEAIEIDGAVHPGWCLVHDVLY